jgi:hypothetical protein
LHVWEHRQSQHPEQIPEFPPPRPAKDMILSLIAEQNIEVIQEAESLRNDLKNSMVEFAGIMEACFVGVGQEIKDSSKANEEAFSNLSMKLDEKFKEIDSKIKDNNMKEGGQRNVNTKLNNLKEKHEAQEEFPKADPKNKNEVKVAWIGTSISKLLDVEKFEKENGVKVKAVKAYGGIS